MLRTNGDLVTQDWAKWLEGRLQTRATEAHSSFSRHHQALCACVHSTELPKTYGVQVLYTHLSAGYWDNGTKCPRTGAPKADPWTGAGQIFLILLEPRHQEKDIPYTFKNM